jgi:hypothetical protein
MVTNLLFRKRKKVNHQNSTLHVELGSGLIALGNSVLVLLLFNQLILDTQIKIHAMIAGFVVFITTYFFAIFLLKESYDK